MKHLELYCQKKDVDGFNPINVGKLCLNQENICISCTPYGIMKMFEEYDIDLTGKEKQF